MKKIDRTGETNYNYQNYLMKIINYNFRRDIIVEFQDENQGLVHTQYENFTRGTVKNPYHPQKYGVGFVGNGMYKAYTENHTVTKQYEYWHHILQRCYDKKLHIKFPTYSECTICDIWKCLQNFGKWFDENYYTCGNEKMCIDKDIIIKGNKIYSPLTCVFTPHKINTLIIKNDKRRGEFPIGVSFDKSINKYKALVCINAKQKNVGNYETIEEAFNSYKKAKENHIKQVADEYKLKYPQFPQKLYDALYRYKVEITD